MNQRNTALILLSILLAGLLVWWFSFGMLNGNKLIVSVDSTLAIEKVKVEIGRYTTKGKSDEQLVSTGLEKTIFNGDFTGDFKTICGENDFYVMYDSQYYTVFRHFIPNDFYDGTPEAHRYFLNLKRTDSNLMMSLHIEGDDGIDLEKSMTSISEAKQNFWGIKELE